MTDGVGHTPPSDGLRPGAPLAAIVVAVLAVAAASYAAMQDDSPGSGVPTETVRPTPTVSFDAAYGPELGPFGQLWQWMGSTGRLVLRGGGQHYVGFRALSIEGARNLSVESGGSVTVGELPRAYIVGPLTADGAKAIVTQPGERRISARDARRVSVFLSGPRLSSTPVVALPGKGFYPPEPQPDGSEIRWLREDGVVDVVAGSRNRERAWVTMLVRSRERRTVTVEIENGRSLTPVLLAPGAKRSLTVGPIPVGQGRGRFRLRVEPGPVRGAAADPRQLSALVLRIDAELRPAP